MATDNKYSMNTNYYYTSFEKLHEKRRPLKNYTRQKKDVLDFLSL